MLTVKEGNLDGMALLFERHHHPLFKFLFRMTGNHAASEDLLQTVFYRLIRYRHTFSGKGEFRTWMYHVARNVLKDNAKKIKKAGYQYNIVDFEESIANGESADERVVQQQEMAVLMHALQQLPAEYREALVLSRIECLKYSEIGEVLDISEGAAKIRVYRAIDQLRNIYRKFNTKAGIDGL